MEADAVFEFGLETLGGPSVTKEKEFQAGTFAVLTKNLRVTEEFGDAFDDRDDLIPSDEGVEPRTEVRFGGEASGNAMRESDFRIPVHATRDRGKANVVDLGIRAPDRASGDGDFELAWQVVELGVAGKQARGFEDEWGGIDEFVGIDAGNGASGNVAHNIAAGADGVESDLPETVENFGEGLDGDPMELDILTNGKVGDSVGVALGQIGDGAELRRGHDAVGNTDAHHKTLDGASFAVLASSDAGAVTLGVHAPPAEVGSDPFRWDGGKTFAGEAANLGEAVPWIHGALEAFGALRFGFFRLVCCRRHFFAIKNPPPVGLAVGSISAEFMKLDLGQQ